MRSLVHDVFERLVELCRASQDAYPVAIDLKFGGDAIEIAFQGCQHGYWSHRSRDRSCGRGAEGAAPGPGIACHGAELRARDSWPEPGRMLAYTTS